MGGVESVQKSTHTVTCPVVVWLEAYIGTCVTKLLGLIIPFPDVHKTQVLQLANWMVWCKQAFKKGDGLINLWASSIKKSM